MARFTVVLPLFFSTFFTLLLFVVSSDPRFPRSRSQPAHRRGHRPTLQFPWKQPNSQIPSSLRPSPSRQEVVDPRLRHLPWQGWRRKGETATEMKLKIVDFTDPATLADSIVKRGGPVPRLPDVPAEYTFIEFGGAGNVGRGNLEIADPAVAKHGRRASSVIQPCGTESSTRKQKLIRRRNPEARPHLASLPTPPHLTTAPHSPGRGSCPKPPG